MQTDLCHERHIDHDIEHNEADLTPAYSISSLWEPNPLCITEAEIVASKHSQLVHDLLCDLKFLNEGLGIQEDHKNYKSEHETDVDLGESSFRCKHDHKHQRVASHEEYRVVLDC